MGLAIQAKVRMVGIGVSYGKREHGYFLGWDPQAKEIRVLRGEHEKRYHDWSGHPINGGHDTFAIHPEDLNAIQDVSDPPV